MEARFQSGKGDQFYGQAQGFAEAQVYGTQE